MKLNFWQWLGLILLVLAGGYWLYDKATGPNGAGTGNNAPTTQATTR